MEDTNLHFDDRGYSHYREFELEQTARQENEFVCDLSHLGFLRAAGSDAVEFLHGQLTNDLKKLPQIESQLAGYCTPKGRVLGIFRAFYDQHSLVLQVHKDTISLCLERLRKFILRAKVDLSVDTEIDSFGVVGGESSGHLEKIIGALPQNNNECHQVDGLTIICYQNSPFPRYQVIGTLSALTPVWQKFDGLCPKLGSWSWASVDIEQGLATVFSITSEQFTPQMVNMDITGAVSFNKGCYPGQEIVARTHYLGKLKTRMILGNVDTNTSPLPGDKVYATDGEQSIGLVVDATPGKQGYDLLATARLEYVHKDGLQLRNGTATAIEIGKLPYSLDS
ncbi:MAG: hypothetical protein QNI91_11770 [Arenicellales bacterium]|nr:hypothetical protein [Arenicellales bacterium]